MPNIKRILGVLAGLLMTTAAYGQSGSSVRQSGSVTPNHAPAWVSGGIIGDGGTAADSPITSFGVTSNTTAGFCVSSGRSTASGRQQLCFGAPLTGNAVISLQNYGTATAKGLDFIVNGVTASIPTGGGDFLTGTGPYVAGGIPCFTSTTSAVTDCGLVVSSGTITTGVWQGTPVAVGYGGTGGTTAATARTNLGLGSIATQSASAVAITGGTVTGMPSPSGATDVAIKSYVDSLASGLRILAPSTLATAAVLPNTPTYANGASGVGATLTAGSNTTLTVDGTAAPLATVVLVKNQASAFQNGIYTVTTAGSGSAPWVLTRATYFDTAAEMLAGSYTFITSGATNLNSSYTLQTTVATVGTDAATFVQFSAGTGGVTSIAGNSGAFTLGSGITNSTNQLLLYSDPGSITNCTLVTSFPGNALTVDLKTQSGAAPSASSPCTISFGSATLATGDYTAVLVTAATTIALAGTGSSLGALANTPFRVWVTAINNAGTVVLGLSQQTSSESIFPLEEGSLQSTTACNGCMDATSAGVIYTTAAQTSKAMRILGYLEWSSGLASPGTWSSVNTSFRLMGPGVRKPNDVVSRHYVTTSTPTSIASTSYAPTALAKNFTKSSAANPVRVDVTGSALAGASGPVEVVIRVARSNSACTTGIGISSVTDIYITSAIAGQSINLIDMPSSGSTTAGQYTLCVKTSGNPAEWPNTSGGAMILEEIQG